MMKIRGYVAIAVLGAATIVVILVGTGVFFRGGHKMLTPTNDSGIISDADLLVTISREDFPADFPAEISLPMRRDESLGPHLREDYNLKDFEGVVKDGETSGPWLPDMKEVTEPTARPPIWWTSISYFVFDTTEAARRHVHPTWQRQVALVPGSFTGEAIGDECFRCNSAPRLFALEFVRGNVRVLIIAIVEDENYNFDPKILEITAKAIQKRIDRVLSAKGKIEPDNLPPVRPHTIEPPPPTRAPTSSDY